LGRQKRRARRDGDAEQALGRRGVAEQAEIEQQRRHHDRAQHRHGEACRDGAPRHLRAVAPVGEIGDQEGEGIDERAPGQNVRKLKRTELNEERKLHGDIRGEDDRRHRRNWQKIDSQGLHFFNLGNGTSDLTREPRRQRSSHGPAASRGRQQP